MLSQDADQETVETLEAFEQWKKEQQHAIEWYSLPLIPVAAGGTLFCDETDFRVQRDYGTDAYAVKVCGDSMKPLIEDGSILIMQATENLPGTHPKEGEIYDFEINGERTLKRFNIRKATPEEIKDESCDYIYVSNTSGS